jgi:cytoskeletal protein RodZ
MDQERRHFGNRLREEREARAISLRQLADKTKIPERSLERLESGRWSELPADVFVRGFVKSYARCVGLDADDMLRRYGEIVHGAAQARPDSLADVVRAAVPRAARRVTTESSGGGVGRAEASRSDSRNDSGARPAAANEAPTLLASEPERSSPRPATRPPSRSESARAVAAGSGADREVAVAASDGEPRAEILDELRQMSRALLDAGRETRRMPLTLAVIILVIVATLTMSLLLNRPSHVGDGLSRAPIGAPAHVRG